MVILVIDFEVSDLAFDYGALEGTMEQSSSGFGYDLLDMVAEHFGGGAVEKFFGLLVPVDNDSLAIGADNGETGTIEKVSIILGLNVSHVKLG